MQKKMGIDSYTYVYKVSGVDGLAAGNFLYVDRHIYVYLLLYHGFCKVCYKMTFRLNAITFKYSDFVLVVS